MDKAGKVGIVRRARETGRKAIFVEALEDGLLHIQVFVPNHGLQSFRLVPGQVHEAHWIDLLVVNANA